MNVVTRRAALALLTTPAIARAQGAGWTPDRRIRFVLPNIAGSGADTVVRVVAPRLADRFGQPVVVENIPGGAGVQGITTVARAAADGYTAISAISSILLAPIVDPSLPYDVQRDFVPVTQYHFGAGVLCVASADTRAATLAEFFAEARAEPARYDIGTYGHGSASHVQAALLIRSANLGVNIVPYQGSPPVMRDMLGGHMRAAFLDSASALTHIRSGSFRALAVSGPRRIGVLPDVPTFLELGLQGFEPVLWQGLFLPTGTPPPVLASWEAAAREAVANPEVADRFRTIGFEPVGGSSAEFAATIAREKEVWTRIIRDLGLGR